MTDPRCTGTLAPEYAERLPLIRVLAPHGTTERTPEEFERLAAFDAPMGPVPEFRCTTQDRTIDGPHGPVPVRVYLPLEASGPRPALVWLHGGAFVMGDLDTVEADQSARFLADAGFPVVSVDYRLASPTVHHPVPEDDCVAAYQWVRGGGLGDRVDTARLAVGGGSAGACLAASVALRMRDAGTPPWQLLMVYPVVHADKPAPSAELAACLAQLADTPMMMPDGSHARIVGLYLGEAAVDTPYAFPAEHDPSGLCPTYIENCEFDDLRASGEAYAHQLADAGVDVEQRCAPGVPHGHLSVVGSPHAFATLGRLRDRLDRP